MTVSENNLVLEKIEEISHEYRKSVSLTFDYNLHCWRAECFGETVASLVGPIQVLEDLQVKLGESKHSKDPTKFMPAVGGNDEES